jgi:hypothetical protein
VRTFAKRRKEKKIAKNFLKSIIFSLFIFVAFLAKLKTTMLCRHQLLFSQFFLNIIHACIAESVAGQIEQPLPITGIPDEFQKSHTLTKKAIQNTF